MELIAPELRETLSASGMDGAWAGQILSSMVFRLMKPEPPAMEQLIAWGVHLTEEDSKPRPLQELFREIALATDGEDPERLVSQVRAVFGDLACSAALELIRAARP